MSREPALEVDECPLTRHRTQVRRVTHTHPGSLGVRARRGPAPGVVTAFLFGLRGPLAAGYSKPTVYSVDVYSLVLINVHGERPLFIKVSRDETPRSLPYYQVTTARTHWAPCGH
eukprot:5914574-Prymnesium_polylepis.1